MDVVYDCEVFPNFFTACMHRLDTGTKLEFQISPWRDDTRTLIAIMNSWKLDGVRMIGFNNLGFDYLLLHMICRMGWVTPQQIYSKAQAIIAAENKFEHLVFPSDRIVPQIDLFKIHHFDNKARQTSLKALEFNMRMRNIRDLPFPVGTMLTKEQAATVTKYCWNDVEATVKFLEHTKEQLEFREGLAPKYPQQDVLNYSDVKLGKTIFQTYLEGAGVECYTYGPNGRVPKQTPRKIMELRECIPDCVSFYHSEFESVKKFFEVAIITQTKGAFDGLHATVGGLRFDFGTGGIHASVENEQFNSSDDMMILDIDVTSMYPSIAIEHNYYPEHLGPKFVEVYRKLREERLKTPKGSTANAALKLALNGVYGASGDQFSIFYDPLFTMKITIGGQLMAAMLADRLTMIPSVRIIQANTDGMTLYFPRELLPAVQVVCGMWEHQTKLKLESVEYRKMCVADVNSYIAQTVEGKIKRKGRYEYDVGWHQDASSLVVQKIAERVLLEGANAMQLLRVWPDEHDFMIRVKVPRSSALVGYDPKIGDEVRLENTQRFYASVGGVHLFKYMPPLAKKPNEWRRIGVLSGQTVTPCNDMDNCVLNQIDYRWYLNEIEKLTLGVL